MALVYGKYSLAVKEHIPEGGWNHSAVEKPVPPIRQRLANNLRELLKEEPRSGNSIAELARVDGKTFNNLLHARFDPRLTVVEKVARGFGMEAWQILAANIGEMPANREFLRLLELYLASDQAGREAILSVAAAVSRK
jgi:hypothetical protein